MRLVALLFLLAVVGGCSTPPPSDGVLNMDGSQYDVAFDAAEAVARRHGLPPAMRDRRGGVLQTHAGSAASVLEPDDPAWAGPGERVASTFAHLRRRARFEFLPAGRLERSSDLGAAPDLLGLRPDGVDLTDWTGRVELRVWVDVERSNLVGFRRDPWTRAATTRTVIVPPEGRDDTHARTFWVPVARDYALESRLLAEVQRAIADAASTTASAARRTGG